MRKSIIGAALFTCVAAVPAVGQAQQAAPATVAASPYPACTKTPSKAEVDAAHGAYLAGRHSFDEGDYATAIMYFKDAYRRDCTKHELLPIVARAYELSQNRGDAILALETFLKRAPANDPQIEAIKKRIQNLRALEPKSASPAPEPAAAPASTAASPTPGATPPQTAAGTPASLSPMPVPDENRKLSMAPWVLIGAGAVGAVVGAVVLFSGLSKRSDAVDRCPNEVGGERQCPEGINRDEVERQFDSGTSQATIGGVVTGISVAAVGGGILWLVLDRTSRVAGGPRAETPMRASPFGTTVLRF